MSKGLQVKELFKVKFVSYPSLSLQTWYLFLPQALPAHYEITPANGHPACREKGTNESTGAPPQSSLTPTGQQCPAEAAGLSHSF